MGLQKNFKKLNKYYSLVKLVNFIKANKDSDFIFINLNSYKNIHLFLLKEYCYKNSFDLTYIKSKYINYILTTDKKSNKKYINFLLSNNSLNLNIFKNLFKNVNYLLSTNINLNGILLNNLIILNHFDKKIDSFDNVFVNFICIKLKTHKKLTTVSYLYLLLNKYGLITKHSINLIIYLLKFSNIKLLKVLNKNNK